MKDLEGMIITSTSGQNYLLTEKVDKQGAQGVVYEESTGKFIIKLYKRGNEFQNRNRLNKLEWLAKQSYPDQFIKPLDIFVEPYIGYAMEKVVDHVSLNKLLVPSREMSLSEWYNEETGGLRRRLFLGYKIAMQFALLHESNRAYCDISGNNILVNKENAERLQVARKISQELNSIGFETSVEAEEFSVYSQRLYDGDFDIFVGGWNMSVDPDLRFIFHSNQIGGNNFISYSNETMDSLLYTASIAIDEEAQKVAYSNLQKFIADELPYVSIVFRDSAVFTGDGITGSINPVATNIFRNIDKWQIKTSE